MITTGIPPLDDYLHGGWPWGSLVTLGGSLKSGRSLFAIDTSIEQYFSGHTVGFLSMDMPIETLTKQVECKLVDATFSDVRSGHCDRERLEVAWKGFREFGRQHGCRWSAAFDQEELDRQDEEWNVLIVDGGDWTTTDYESVRSRMRDRRLVRLETAQLDRLGNAPLRLVECSDYVLKWELLGKGPVAEAEFTLVKARQHPAPFRFRGTFDFERMRMEWEGKLLGT